MKKNKKNTSKNTESNKRFEALDSAVERGIMDAIVDMQNERFGTFDDFVRMFVRSTVMSDTYWELMHQYVHGDSKLVEKLADKVRSRHTKLIRVAKGASGHIEIQVSEEVPEIH